MGKKIFTLLFVLASLFSYTQSLEDAFRLSSYFHNGSARFNSMGGAFGALGGDISSISINPAGSSVFIKSEVGFSVDITDKLVKNSFNNYFSESRSDFLSINNVGAVLVYGNNKSKISIGYNMHNLNSFDTNFSFNGKTTAGLDNYFLFYSQDIPYEDLLVYDNETIQSVYEFLGDEYGYADQQAFLGFQSFIINPNEDGSSYYSNAIYSSLEQHVDISRKGSHNMHTFNISKSLKENFLIGLNINFHEIFYDELKTISEEGFDFNSKVNSISFYDDLYTQGIGTSLQIGSIFILKNLRIGLTYQSPTWFKLEDENIQSIRSDILEDDYIIQYDINPNTVNYFEEYNFKAPSKSTISLAYVFGSRGLISVDYEHSRPSNSNFKDNNGSSSYLNNLNNLIDQKFSKSSNSLRIGGEYRIKNYSLRVGTYKYEGILNDGDNNISGISFGFGYNFGYFDIDIGYSKLNNKYSSNLLTNGLNSSYSSENLINSIYTSISIKL
tara:strand:- start:1752 stop:3245 length:1494 start_codon:yes stop_codon:yes gene_type:complete